MNDPGFAEFLPKLNNHKFLNLKLALAPAAALPEGLAGMFSGRPAALKLLNDPSATSEPRTDLGVSMKTHNSLMRIVRLSGGNYRAEQTRILFRVLSFFMVPDQAKWRTLIGEPEEDFVESQYIVSSTQVPRIIHQIWIGPKLPPSATFDAWHAHAKKHGYEYKVWTDIEVAELDVVKTEAFKFFHDRGTYAACADLIRYEVLLRFGGIYIDADLYPLGTRSLHERIIPYGMSVVAETGARLHPTTGGTLFANSFIATPPANPVFRRILGKVEEALETFPGISVWMVPGPYIFTAMTHGFANVLGSTFVSRGPNTFTPDVALFESTLEETRKKRPLAALIPWKPWKQKKRP